VARVLSEVEDFFVKGFKLEARVILIVTDGMHDNQLYEMVE